MLSPAPNRPCYVLLPDRVAIHLSTPRAVEDGMAAFAAQLGVAVRELAELLES
ncbi:hypothetical protein [Cryptosporangium japonicum]|uniref:Uncharacterized protein n=1 Tax=Cryptosporangium japonicum TaxID=80872 RepID=A0ABN0U114_9ACTN